ncbi:MAG TPA: hypothetical protein VMH81_39205 [Bryobacteraceae bacterium]|nr:hypothetical protein [Bryobacteraceae bacterium]
MLVRTQSILVLAFCAISASAQTNISAVASAYPMPSVVLGGNTATVGLTVGYPANLSATSYISGLQLAADFLKFYTAYPNPNDPPEAVLSSVLSSILSKYPQMTGGALGAIVPPLVLATGVIVTGGGQIGVAMGTIPSLTSNSRSPISLQYPSVEPAAKPAN